MDSGSSPDRAYSRSEFDREVSRLLDQILAVSPAERQFFLANRIREMQGKEGAEFGDRLEILRAAVKRGNLLLELKAAKEILEVEKLRQRRRLP